MKQRIDLSVVILNYNTVDLTRICLQTVLASKLGKYTMEVIVCDNASSDGSMDMVKREFPGVILIDNKKNIGFAAGNNPGIKRAKGRYILLLNSDTEVPSDTFKTMIAFMDGTPVAGAATCKLVLPNGSMDPACHRGFPTPWVAFTYLSKLEALFPRTALFGEYHQQYKDLSTIHEVDCISGAFFMMRRECFRDVGLMDEEYFMYGEDIDWSYRVRSAGWKIMYNPTVTVLHKKKQSGRANILKKRRVTTEIYFHQYNWLFYKKHFEKKYGPILAFFVNGFYTTRIFLLQRFGI
jgi:GT2 family glycosyltransferase